MSTYPKISVAASKSYLQRALAISALAQGTSVLKDISWCEDSNSAKQIVEGLGAKIVEKGRELTIRTDGLDFKQSVYNAGEAGLSIRMFAPILALASKEIILKGEGSLISRPQYIVADALSKLGVEVRTHKGLLPIQIKGPIKAGSIEIDGSLSSQLLTGLLIALPLADGDSTIKVRDLKSKPYIDMTLSIMQAFGVEVEHEDYQNFYIKGCQTYKDCEYAIEGDWSGAAFFLVYGAISGGIEIVNLNKASLQADKAILEALSLVGALVSLKSDSILVEKANLNAFEFDATDCPDLFPPLVCLASQCKGISRFKGVSRLIHKESNRALVLQKEFRKMGISIVIEGDEMYVTGGRAKACNVDSHNDHRIAMAAAIMNLFCEGNIEIENKEAINKSYPSFFDELSKL
jgi:3-phosphoshikimate 1-carboxyvinyltransferase